MSWIELVAQRRPQQMPQGVTPPENAADWYRIENSTDDPDSTDIFVYDSIGGWFGMYADDFIRELKEVSTKKINLRLNSPGGSVFEGIAIANAIRSHPATVTVYVDALAASIASVIMLAGDRVVMQPQSQVMIHNASGGCYGDATEMTKMADLLDKQSRNIAEAYAERTGRPLAEWQEYMAAETWFTAKEAVEVGLADEATPMRPKQDAPEPVSARMHASWDLSMYRYAGREKAPEPRFAVGGVVNRVGFQGEHGPETVQLPTAKPKTSEITVHLGADSEKLVEALTRVIRTTIRDELAVVTGTVAPKHTTAVKEGTWDAGANEGHLPSPVPVATAKKVYTYYDEDKVEDGAIPKSACKLPHHFVSEDGTPGAASINGVRNALARLPQTKGLSDEERSAAEAHLRQHLDAFSDETVSEDGDDVTDAAKTEEAEDGKEKKLPPWLKPDEEEEDDEDAEDAADEGEPEASVSDDPVPDEPGEPAVPVETPDPPKTPEPDAWAQALVHLTESSRSADDVFNHLKEAWT